MTPLLQITPKPRTLQELFADHMRWTKNENFRLDNGSGTPLPDNATSCCLYGAMEVVYGDIKKIKKARDKISAIIGDHYITKWNDAPERTIEDIRAVVEKAGV